MAPTPRWTPSAKRQRDARAKRPNGTPRSGQPFRWRPELYQARHGLLKASEPLTERERRRLCDFFARPALEIFTDARAASLDSEHCD